MEGILVWWSTLRNSLSINEYYQQHLWTFHNRQARPPSRGRQINFENGPKDSRQPQMILKTAKKSVASPNQFWKRVKRVSQVYFEIKRRWKECRKGQMKIKMAEKSVFRHFIYNLVYAISRVLRQLIKGAIKSPQRRHKEREHPIRCSLLSFIFMW